MNPEEIRPGLAGVLVVIGALLIAIGAIGLVRLPDMLCRNHAASKALTLGIALMLAGLWVARAGTGAGPKLALAIIFQVISIPVAGHLLALAAHSNRLPRFRPRAESAQAGGSDAHRRRRAPHPSS